MTRYIEQFEILGVGRLAIEDYEAPGDHFFPEEYKSGKCKRYRLWSSGSSFGTMDTLEEAREGVLRHALKTLKEQRIRLTSKTRMVGESQSSLIFHPRGRSHTSTLTNFQVDPAKHGLHTIWNFNPKE